MTVVTVADHSHDSSDWHMPQRRDTLSPNCASWRFIGVFRYLASFESVSRSFIATVALLLVVTLIAGGIGISGPAILTFSIWISLIGLVAVGAFLVARAQRPYAGAGAIVAALAVWIAYFWRANPGPFLWPVVFILAAGLISYGTRQDVSSPTA